MRRRWEHATASELLTCQRPGDLFSLGEPEPVGQEYRTLVKRWHPDVSADPRAAEVLRHLTDLKAEADRHLRLGLWEGPATLRVRPMEGRPLELRFHRRWTFPLGTAYLCRSALAFWIDPSALDFHQAAQRVQASLHFADEAMRRSLAPSLPQVRREVHLPDGSLLVLLHKAPELLRLRDVLDHQGGRLDARHGAWVVSGLLNLACYLDHLGLGHHDLSLETVFVDPEQHRVVLPGAWWYATPFGQPLRGVPAHTLRLMPPDLRASGRSDGRTDLALIRVIAQELLGAPSGHPLLPQPDRPAPMVAWALERSLDAARETYRAWQEEVLPACFGKRRFTTWALRAEDLYANGPSSTEAAV